MEAIMDEFREHFQRMVDNCGFYLKVLGERVKPNNCS